MYHNRGGEDNHSVSERLQFGLVVAMTPPNDGRDDLWLLVTSHPDDESMFFVPALRNLLPAPPRRRRLQRRDGDGKDVAAAAGNGNDHPTNDSSPSRSLARHNRTVGVLCLSNGDYRDPSDGPVREGEMRDACSAIGVTTCGDDDDFETCQNNAVAAGDNSVGAGRVTVLDDDRMKDGPKEVWNADVVSERVLEHVRDVVISSMRLDNNNSGCAVSDDDERLHRTPRRDYLLTDPDDDRPVDCCGAPSSSSRSTKSPAWQLVQDKRAIKIPSGGCNIRSVNVNLLTFDGGGVSGHPNHVDTHRGVRHLLNEKCYVAGGGCSKREEGKLWLCPATKADGEENANTDNTERNGSRRRGADVDVVELSVSVYALRTISNPLRKYFLWMVVDIIPFAFVWLFQVGLCLLYFLLGGVLWNFERPHVQTFSGTTITSNKGSSNDDAARRYRIMDPTLVWRAMAAHRSQFVWYRRLSVAFSRYTYINDVERLVVDAPPFDDEGETGDGASFPPVATVEEEGGSAPEFLLTSPQMNALRDAAVPIGLHHRPWKRIYSLSRDGDSFVAFQKRMEDWIMVGNKENGGGDARSTILVVRTAGGDTIGGYSSAPLVPLAGSVVENASKSCLFKLRRSSEGSDERPVVDVYGKAASSSKQVMFSSSRRIVAFGGGSGDGSDGGTDEGFGLCLEDGFARGTTSRCSAFGSEPLVPNRDGVFEVLDVEVWGFVFGQM